MPEVIGYTTTKVDSLLADVVVGATIDSGTGHITLISKDGTQTDIGSILTGLTSATTTAQGIVELATDVETIAGTDTVRATTPFGVAAKVTAALNAIPGTKVQVVSAQLETALPTAYPTGISLMTLSGTGTAWSLNGGVGTVVTTNPSTNFAEQRFYVPNGASKFPRQWVRQYNSTDGGWSGWSEVLLLTTLAAGSYTQASALTTYPQGMSRIYYTNTTSTGWDFSGKYGEIITFRDGTDFAKQEFNLHANGSSSYPYTERWIRTANASGGWTPWLVLGTGKLVGKHTRNAAALSGVGATEIGFIRIDNIPVKAGYSYEVVAPRCIMTTTSTTTLGCARIRGSQSGVATVSSTQLEGAELRPGVAIDTSSVPEQAMIGYWDATASGLLSIIVTLQRVAGSGTVGLYSALNTVVIPVRVKEVGPTPADSGTDL